MRSTKTFWTDYAKKTARTKKKRPLADAVLLQYRDGDSIASINDDQHYCLVGVNGSGKSQLMCALEGTGTSILSGKVHARNEEVSVANLSFQCHGDFLRESGTETVADVLGGLREAWSRQLIVRFGLYPVWHRPVYCLSTGEIRKVMLAQALSKRPRVLLLDQPFDGLDSGSRAELGKLLAQLMQGFSKLLVELGGDDYDRYDTRGDSTVNRNTKTQLVVVTQRDSELEQLKGVTSAIHMSDMAVAAQGSVTAVLQGRTLETFLTDSRRIDPFLRQAPTEVMIPPSGSKVATAEDMSVGVERESALSKQKRRWRCPRRWEEAKARLARLVREKHAKCTSTTRSASSEGACASVLFDFQGVVVDGEGGDILTDLAWQMFPGESYAVIGANGAGKVRRMVNKHTLGPQLIIIIIIRTCATRKYRF
jgi:ABC-type molybdenum transport system ATPase subunit/photorepair protein PhrA